MGGASLYHCEISELQVIQPRDKDLRYNVLAMSGARSACEVLEPWNIEMECQNTSV